MPDQPEYGTSHISIVDALRQRDRDDHHHRGRVRRAPDGRAAFLLNNELTDFSFAPADAEGKPVANRVQPGKRPRSSMAPTLVFDKATGQLVMSGGSPGGALIIHYTAKTLYGVLNWGLTAAAGHQPAQLRARSTARPCWKKSASRRPPSKRCKRRGHEVREMAMTSGLQAITRGQAHGTPLLLGGADPRREGVVMGD